ncbi:MAG: GxxExxY protein [Bacteroidetes bacterium]|nr:GxxExxY protein [Bacteroidota bacterium]
MIDETYKYSEMTGQIIGLAMEVHNHLGNGFQEVIYKDLNLSLQKSNKFDQEFEMRILYRGENIGTRRVDFLINKTISVEIKAVIQLEPVHLAQAMNYLEAYNLEVGLLLNVGAQSLQN